MSGKLALLFLTTGDLPFADLWLKWLEGWDRVKVLVHAHHRQAVFSPFRKWLIHEHVDDMRHGARAPHNRGAKAIVALMRAALEDRDVQRMVVLSDSALPIQAFDLAFGALMSEDYSWISAFPCEAPYPERYEQLRPCGIPKEKFLCSDQLVALTRRHAQIVVDAAPQYLDAFEDVVAAAEHYFPTMLAMAGVDMTTETTGQVPTYVDWSQGPPREFKIVTEEDIATFCFSGKLFARKFPISSSIREYWPDLLEANRDPLHVANKGASRG